MGFRYDPTVFNLSFEGTNLDGLHVKMGCTTIREYNAMLTLAEEGSSAKKVAELNERWEELFLKYLIEWDMQDSEGQPFPTSREAFGILDSRIVAQLVTAWQMAMISVPNPSKTPSPNGNSSVEASLGLGSASSSLGN
jgi:hypothetical protein